MSEVTSAAEAPVVEATTTETVSTNDTTVSTVDTAPAVEAKVEETKAPEAPDYSFVPKKYLKDGKPDLEGLSKAYSSLEKKLGQKGLIVPEDVAEYEYTPSSEALFDSEEKSNSFKAEAQKAGLSKEQYAFVMGQYENLMINMGFDAASSEAVLQKEWGDNYKTHVKQAQRAFEEFAPSDVSLDDPILNHPTVIKLLARFGQELGEDSQTVVKGSASRPAGMSKDDVIAIMKEKDYYNNPAKLKLVSDWYAKNTK